jgi:hypothetical protein
MASAGDRIGDPHELTLEGAHDLDVHAEGPGAPAEPAAPATPHTRTRIPGNLGLKYEPHYVGHHWRIGQVRRRTSSRPTGSTAAAAPFPGLTRAARTAPAGRPRLTRPLREPCVPCWWGSTGTARPCLVSK